MKIAINGQTLLTEEYSPTGPYVYTFSLIRTLAQIDHVNEYVIYLSDQYTRQGSFEDLTLGNPNFEVKVVKKTSSWTQIDLLKALWQDKPDVFFTAIHTLPILAVPWLKTVAMIHGLEYKFSPISQSWKRYFQALPIWFTAFAATKIIVPSEATRNAIAERFHFIKADKITVIPEGVNPVFTPRDKSEVEHVRAKYGILDSKYLFFISTIQPRKNIPNMVAGFAAALKELNMPDLKLVLSGKLGWLYRESTEAPEKFGIKDNVIFLGPAITEDLPALLSGSFGYINLSFEEGFGLTLLEAMSCGAPCIASDIVAFKELDLGNFIMVSTTDVESIKQGIVKLFRETADEREKRIKAGFENVSRFSWEITAKKTLAILNS